MPPDQDPVRTLLALSPVFGALDDAALVELGNLVSTLTEELAVARFQSLEDRVYHAIEQLAGDDGRLEITHAELAAHVGATRANVSRALEHLDGRDPLEGRKRVRISRGLIELIED